MTLPRDTDGRLSRWAWPGGYPLYYVTKQGCVQCSNCARMVEVLDALGTWHPETGNMDPTVGAAVNWEDADLWCEDCEKRVESAYAEDEVTP